MKTIQNFTSAIIIVIFSVVGVVAQDHNNNHGTEDKDKAQHYENHATSESSHDDHEKEDSHHIDHGKAHHIHKNHVAFNIGTASNLTHKATLMAVGGHYEYRLSKKFGIGVGAEYLTGDKTTELIFAIPITYHPIGGLKFVAAPLLMKSKHSGGHEVEVTDTHGDEQGEGHGDETTTESEWGSEFGILIGVGYDFHMGNFTITPSLNTEIIGESTILAPALSFGFGF